jgi:hypothetical protein
MVQSDPELQALRATALAASGARKDAHDWIVRRFRAQLQGMDGGPSEADLQRFARSVQLEQALHRELGFAVALAAGALG